MKKYVWTALVFLVVIAAIVIAYATAMQPALTLTANLTEPLAEASNNTTLLFLGNKNIAPVVFLDGTTPYGVAVDIVRALANHMSQPIEIKAMDWSEAQVLVARGDADALIQINPTEERNQIYDFSDPLLESHFSIFTRADRMGISGISSLRGLRVGVESGGLPQRLLEKDPQVQLIIIPNFTNGFRQLNEGSVDTVVVDYRVGSYILAVNNIRNIKISGEPIESSYSSIAVKKGNTQLLNEINTALQIIKADGTYEKIIKKWQPKETVFETQEQITERNYLYIILFLLILFLIAGLWIVTIKKDLTRRKAAEDELLRKNEKLLAAYEQITATEEELRENFEELKKREDVIRESEEKYRSLVEHNPYGVLLTSPCGAILSANAAACRLLGRTEDEIKIIGRSGVVDTRDPRVAAALEEREKAGSAIAKEMTFIRRDGSRFEGEVSSTIFLDRNGQTMTSMIFSDISDRKRAEKERLATIFFFESMDKVNQAIQGTDDLEQMMSDVLDTVLSIFDCDRAWLLYPCDPEAASWRTPMERTKPGYPGAYALGLEIPMDEDVAEVFRTLLVSEGPVKFGPGTGHSLPENVSNQFGYKSLLSMALHPKTGKAWQFGLHQCSYPRIWTPDEEKLLQEIGWRLADALTSLLTYRNLQESERKFRAIFDQTFEFIGLMTPDGTFLEANRTSLKFSGQQDSDVLGKPIWETPFWSHSEDLQEKLHAAVQDAAQGDFVRFEATHVAADGNLHYIDFSIKPVRDEAGRVILLIPEGRDVTDRKEAEDALQKSGWEWQITFNAITDAVFLLDNEGRIIRHNRAFETSTGKPAGEIDGRYCFEVMHGTTSPVEGCPMEKAKKSRQRERLELKIGNRWFIAAVDPVFSDTGKISGGVHLLIDITERKLAEEALFSSRQMLQLVLDSIPQRVFWKDRNSVFLGCNKPLALDAGFTEPADMVGKTDYDHASHATADLYRADDRQVMETGQPKVNYEEPQIRPDGSHVWLRTTKVPLRNQEGTIIGVLGTYEDITERKMAQEALQESEERFRNIFTHAAEGILIADISTQEFLYANPAICTMLGYSAQELTAMGMRDIHPEKDRAHVQEEFMAQACGEKTLAESIPVLRKDGVVLYMDIRTTPVIIDGHRCNIGMFTDITERKRMENALQLARNKINLLNTLTFQDIQNTSFSLSAYHELLRTLVTDEKAKSFLEKQKSLNRKIVDILNFAKNYQDMGTKPPRWQNVHQVFLFAISHLDFLHIARNLQVEDLEVYADSLLEKVFFHLMQNVLRYGEHATKVTLRYEEKPDGLVLFVEDNGVGIPDEEKHMIFDRGYGKNTGLGLFFVREVLSITDMTIKETGEPGKGARFAILVPKEGYRFIKEQKSN